MFSVRAMPWHGLGVVLDDYPESIDEALDKAGLGWKVTHGDVLIVKTPELTDGHRTGSRRALLAPLSSLLRGRTGEPWIAWRKRTVR